jgi:hypothetical protein
MRNNQERAKNNFKAIKYGSHSSLLLLEKKGRTSFKVSADICDV